MAGSGERCVHVHTFPVRAHLLWGKATTLFSSGRDLGSASRPGSQHQKTPTSTHRSHCYSSPFSSSSLARRGISLQPAGSYVATGTRRYLRNDSAAVHPKGTNRFLPSSGPTSLLYSSRFPRGRCRGKRPRSMAIATAEVRESTPSFA